MDLTSRKCALREGLKRYFTGKPCKHGHIAERWTRGGHCRECVRERQRLYYAANLEKVREQQRLYRAASPEKIQERQRRWYSTNSEKVNAASRKWAQANAEKVRENARHWRHKNLGKVSAATAQYRQQKRSQICDCCTDEQREAVYQDAHREGLAVDHIIPVSKGGSHCVANFQLLSRSENSSKQARYNPLIEGMQYLQNLGLA